METERSRKTKIDKGGEHEKDEKRRGPQPRVTSLDCIYEHCKSPIQYGLGPGFICWEHYWKIMGAY